MTEVPAGLCERPSRRHSPRRMPIRPSTEGDLLKRSCQNQQVTYPSRTRFGSHERERPGRQRAALQGCIDIISGMAGGNDRGATPRRRAFCWSANRPATAGAWAKSALARRPAMRGLGPSHGDEARGVPLRKGGAYPDSYVPPLTCRGARSTDRHPGTGCGRRSTCSSGSVGQFRSSATACGQRIRLLSDVPTVQPMRHGAAQRGWPARLVRVSGAGDDEHGSGVATVLRIPGGLLQVETVESVDSRFACLSGTRLDSVSLAPIGKGSVVVEIGSAPWLYSLEVSEQYDGDIGSISKRT